VTGSMRIFLSPKVMGKQKEIPFHEPARKPILECITESGLASTQDLVYFGAVGFGFENLPGGHSLRDESFQGELLLLKVLRR